MTRRRSSTSVPRVSGRSTRSYDWATHAGVRTVVISVMARGRSRNKEGSRTPRAAFHKRTSFDTKGFARDADHPLRDRDGGASHRGGQETGPARVGAMGAIVKKICEGCGESFEAARRSQRACSVVCSNLATPRGVADPSYVPKIVTLAERFWPKVDKYGPVHPRLRTRCWLWTGAKFVSSGYGLIGVPNTSGRFQHRRAHRIAWLLETGEPNDCILHRCDVRLCVNLKHLYDGSRGDNARDRVERGRSATRENGKHGSVTRPKKWSPRS